MLLPAKPEVPSEAVTLTAIDFVVVLLTAKLTAGAVASFLRVRVPAADLFPALS